MMTNHIRPINKAKREDFILERGCFAPDWSGCRKDDSAGCISIDICTYDNDSGCSWFDSCGSDNG